MNSDPVCVMEATDTETEYYVVGDGGALGNVFVHVTSESIAGTYPTPDEPILLNQQGCRYAPHVFGVQVGQTVTVRNSDPTLHTSTPRRRERRIQYRTADPGNDHEPHLRRGRGDGAVQVATSTAG